MRFNFQESLLFFFLKNCFQTFPSLKIYIKENLLEVLKNGFVASVAPACTVGSTYIPSTTGLWFEAKNVNLNEIETIESSSNACYNSDED